MNTLESKLLKYGFSKVNYFYYFWYVLLLDKGVYNKIDYSQILYKELNIGRARSVLLELNEIQGVFKTKKYLYLFDYYNNLYKLKL